jgi:Bacteriocin-protection, YdeI or OmpD-Associated/Domain of unknown function (DUF1905)
MATKNKPKRFLATVYKIWMMRHVDVSEEVSSALMAEMMKARKANAGTRACGSDRNGDKRDRQQAAARKRVMRNHAEGRSAKGNAAKPKYIPAEAVVNGRSARVTLVPAGGGRFRMQINTALRKAARVDAGDLVTVELRLDLASRDLPVPADLRDALNAVPKARKAFAALTPAHRRHFIQWFDSAKSGEARQRRSERAIDVLLERALLKPARKAGKRAQTPAR